MHLFRGEVFNFRASDEFQLLLLQIVLANLLSGLGSVLLAARLTAGAQTRLIKAMVSVSTGMMLGTAVLSLLPEVVESSPDLHMAMAVLLAGFVVMFLLEKALLLRHDHHHEGDGHGHHHGHDRDSAGPGGALILVGDSIHGFGDGVLVAAAFLADVHVGWATATAVALHEIPQEIGDFIVLRNAGLSRSRALVYNIVAGLAATVGGIAGYFVLAQMQPLVPLAVAFSASTLMYIALADLVPDLHRQSGARVREEPGPPRVGQRLRSDAGQVGLLLGGIALAAITAHWAHVH